MSYELRDKALCVNAIELLKKLVRTPSFSKEEHRTTEILARWLADAGVEKVHIHGNNVWAANLHFDPAKPTILLCSHHDTVRPGEGWTRDPFAADIEEGSGAPARLYGLGTSDAGASVVSLAAAFIHFYSRNDLKYNLLLALVAEEEISGPGGIRSILPEMGLDKTNAREGDFAIIGEPTMRASEPGPAHDAGPGQSTPAPTSAPEPATMQMAIAEKGLLVLDCVAHGRAGHAARDEGDNAIYHAVRDIEWFRTYRFPRVSDLFGDVKMSVTMISAGTQHNVVPAQCRFTVDIRVTEKYTNQEVLDIVRRHVASTVTPRSTHLRPSSIQPSHPIVEAGKALGITTFGSPTTSDQVALDIPSVKIGPGVSARSHGADEYVQLSEIQQGIETYIALLKKLVI